MWPGVVLLKKAEGDLCVFIPSFYFHFTILIKLTSEMSSGQQPYARVGDDKFQETSVALLWLGRIS